MLIGVMDGKAVFGEYSVKIDNKDDVYIPYNIDKEGIVICINSEELECLKKYLNDNSINYSVETIKSSDNRHKMIAVKYKNFTEALKHYNNEEEPESLAIPSMKASIIEKDEEIKILREELRQFKEEFKDFKKTISIK